MPGEMPADFRLPYEVIEDPAKFFIVRSKGIVAMRRFARSGNSLERQESLEKLLENENPEIAYGVHDFSVDLNLDANESQLFMDASVVAYKLLSLQAAREERKLPRFEERNFEPFFRQYLFGIISSDSHFTHRIEELKNSNRIFIAGLSDYMGNRLTPRAVKIVQTGAVVTHDMLVEQRWRDELAARFFLSGGTYGLRDK